MRYDAFPTSKTSRAPWHAAFQATLIAAAVALSG